MKLFLLNLTFLCSIVFLLGASNSPTPAQYIRLDPHGSASLERNRMSIKKHSECKTCHIPNSLKVSIKRNPEKICASCHGPSPHSGAAEHLTQPKINCLTCHFPHRMDTTDVQAQTEVGFTIQPKSASDIPEDLMIKQNKNALIRKKCTECHQWK